MSIVNDLFKTKQPDGSFKWDITNPAYSFLPWLLSVLVYLGGGVVTLYKVPDAETLMKLALGLGALFSTGLAGVFFHSKANN